jgi:hypothetical protein
MLSSVCSTHGDSFNHRHTEATEAQADLLLSMLRTADAVAQIDSRSACQVAKRRQRHFCREDWCSKQSEVRHINATHVSLFEALPTPDPRRQRCRGWHPRCCYPQITAARLERRILEFDTRASHPPSPA